MRFWQRGGQGFRASPLSPGVPLEGSETVIGLRQLDLQHRTQRFSSRLEFRSQRVGYERYQGPYLHQLTVDDLRKTKPTWQQFFYNGTSAAGWQDAYNVPEHLGMLQERMEENLVYYLGNYIYCIGAVALLTIYLQPIALVGVIFLVASLYVSLVHLDESSDGVSREDSQVNFAPARALLSLVTWFVVMQTRCFGAILSWIVYSVVFVGAHAAFRVPPSEYRTTKRPGVHFREVVGYPRQSTADPHPDPRRVFREVSEQIATYASLTYEHVREMFHHYIWAARVAIYQRTGLTI